MEILLIIIGMVIWFGTNVVVGKIYIKNDGWIIFVLIITGLGMILLGGGMIKAGLGVPKTSINNGTYHVVGYVETSKDNQPYYHLILEQESGVRLYALPKDMIDIAQSGGKGGMLEVVGKSGLRKAILYSQVPGGVSSLP